MLGGITYPNNTAVLIENIGDGDINSLKCTTAYEPCCRSSRQGNFYYPNNDPVLIQSLALSSRQSFYRTRGSGSISLKRQSGDPPPLGRYRCEIPDGRGVLQNLYITIGELQCVIFQMCHMILLIMFVGTIREPGDPCPPSPPPTTCPPTPEPCPTTEPPVTCLPTFPGTWYLLLSRSNTRVCNEREALILSFTGLFFELGDASYLNNTVILMDEIGVGDSALLCRTNNTGCCGSSLTSFRGEFYYPNSNNIVPTAGISPSFYRNRGTGFIRLNRQPNTDIPLGEYRCEILDDRGIRQNLFILSLIHI